MSEAELDACVKELAGWLGILAFHVIRSQRVVTMRGWPDWTLIGSRGILFRENKVKGRKPTPQQRQVGYALQALGQDWDIWREQDWASGRIRAELEAIR